MPHQYSRRTFLSLTLSASLAHAGAQLPILRGKRASILDHGAKADGATLNTRAIQATIDSLASTGGGTVVIPAGTFISGAIFLKRGVHLHLEKGAVLQASTDVAANFPAQRTRIEGHFEEKFTPALINAKGCDGLRITGEGTLDGAGRPIWDQFWKMRNAAPDPHNFPNIGLPRARLAILEESRNITVEGVTFKDSQFWNLHLYKCDGVTVKNARFQVPDDYKQAPSTDGIDLDSCRNVTVDGCFFSVTDDCIAAKGSKGPNADKDTASPPVEHIRVRNCTFKRGNGIVTLGSEATLVRDVQVENCNVIGEVKIAVLKLRPDTPQHYEDIHFRNITLDGSRAPMVQIQPWSQYFDLKGNTPPKSIVRNVTLTGVKGRFGTFGTIKPNPGQTEIADIVFKDINVTLQDPKLNTEGVKGLKFENVIINGKNITSAESLA